MKLKSKTVYYKRSNFSDPAITLQSVLSAALKGKLKKADERREQFTEDEDIFRLINRFTTYSNILFGQFIVYEPNRQQAYLKLEPNKEYYTIESQTTGENEAFADDVYYFGVRDNDMVCIQTRSIREKQLESHLHWLLTTQTDHVADNVILEIVNQPEMKVYRRVKNRSAKAIRIGTHILSEQTQITKKQSKKRFNITGKAGELIRTVIGQSEYEKIRGLEYDLDEANLEAILEVRFTRSTTSGGQNVLDKIASSFRHVDGFDYEVLFKGGGTIRGDEMNINKKIQMRLLDNGLVDETDLYRQMHEFLIATLTNQL